MVKRKRVQGARPAIAALIICLLVQLFPLYNGNVASAQTSSSFDESKMTWHDLSGSVKPGGRTAPAVAYDAKRDQVVLFGGHNNGTKLQETWIWDGASATWTKANPAHSPKGSSGAGMVYDPVHQNIVLFGGDGGSSGGTFNETWIWNGSDWTQASPTTIPPARSIMQMAWDGSQVVLFGGLNGSDLSDTWTWDGLNWTLQSPATSPSKRSFGNMTYDGTGALLFGGVSGSTYYGETWKWNGTSKTWTKISPAVSPPIRAGAGMDFDGERVVLYGGANAGGILNDTWVFEPNSNTWTQANPNKKPEARAHTTLTYDKRGFLLVNGVTTGNSLPTGTFRYELGYVPGVKITGALQDDNAGTVSVTANVYKDDGFPLTAVGIEYRKVGDEDWTTQAASSVSADYSVSLTSLQPNTAYEARAYATNAIGTSTGDIFSLPQLKGTPAVTLTASASAVTYGDPTTLVATVSPGPSGPTPSGTVTFFNSDGTPLGGPVALVDGVATFSVTDLDLGTYQFYAEYNGDTHYKTANSKLSLLEVTVIRSDNSKLGSVSLEGSNGEVITLTPAFDPSLTDYAAEVPYNVTSLHLTSVTQNVYASIDINGDPVASGDPSPDYELDLGDNEITIHVVAQNGDELVYRITVRRAADLPGAPTGVTAAAGDGQAAVSFTPPAYDGGGAITGYEVISSPGNIVVRGTKSPIVISGLTNGQAYTFTVRAINSTGASAASGSSNEVTPRVASTTVASPSVPKDSNDYEVLVNGKSGKGGKSTTATIDNRSVTTVAIDSGLIQDLLAGEGQQAVLTIPVKSDSDVIIAELDGQTVRNMELKQAVLEVVTEYGSYTLPAGQINIQALSEQLGGGIDLQDIKLRVEISKSSANQAKLLENAAAQGQYSVVTPPIDFTVQAVYGGKTVEVSKFNAYVERTIAIPDGVDPNKITTGVAVDPDGTVRHIPTQIIVVDGRYYAKLNSLTNSTYSVIWHPYEFADAANHWAENAINNLGSRLVVDGIGDDLFDPGREITRAEFTAILLRGLGLKAENGSLPFTDVKASDWYSGAIRTANAYGLVKGFDDGTFRPLDRITREQAMAIVANAMTLTGLEAQLPNRDANELLRPFADADASSTWAISGIADCLQAGVVSGRSDSELAPKAYISRAEVTAIVQRLLQKSDLI